jgi:heme/copper-type cytochrome/quinol oxidase subunit 2
MSDPSRFLWFDWYAKWSLVEVQPAPASKFSVVGVPFYKKHFDFNLDSNDTLSETENYFSRLAYARKNYLPTWAYTPYIYTRSKVWLANNPLASFIDNGNNIALKKTLLSMNWYWTTLGFTKNTSETFTPTFSNSSRNRWRPYTSIQAYYYNNAVLTDILTHREFLYRQYLEVNNKVINLPKVLTANPQNPLISEIRSTFLLIDPITYNAEYSREFYYTTLTYFKFLLFKDWTSNLNRTISNLPINTSFVTNYLFFYFLDNNYSNKLGNNQDLFKSQYRPLKKGISNMLRLHGTGAVALPIEIRLQILASSRDVIHSWSIPSAGVKIDCIPGYTSHRIMIFLTPGIYWGQCQEICGRYHHWMPIIVYFMKRDLFFLWCTHFMSKSNYNSTLTTNDRQFTDYIKFASYDRSTWLTEISKSM